MKLLICVTNICVPNRKQTASFSIAGLMLAIAPLWLMLAAAGSSAQAQTTSSPADWTQFHRDNMQRWNPYETVLGVNNVGNLVLKWSGPGYNPTYEYSSPAVENGVVYYSSAGELFALNASTGAQVWLSPFLSGGIASPAVENGVLFNSDYGRVYAYDLSNGTLLWSYYMGSAGVMLYSPTVVNGVVYACMTSNLNGTLVALNASTGAKLWSFDFGGTAFGELFAGSSPAVANGVVYFGGSDGNVYALNATTGALVWTYVTGGGNENPVNGSPAVANGVVYIARNDGHTYALNAATGGKLWEQDELGGSVNSAAAVANGVVYTTDAGHINALNASTGALIWSHTADSSPWYSSPAVANGVVYFGGLIGGGGTVQGYLYALNASTGAVLWKYPTSSQMRSSPVVVNGTVYFHTGTQLLAFGLGVGHADLFLRIEPTPTTVQQGDLLTYAFPVWNLGPDSAVHEVLNTQVPAGTTFDYIRISGTPGLGTCTTPSYGGTGQIICHENSAMAPNTTWTVRLTVKVTAPSGTVITENAATMADTPDPNLVNNTASVSLTVQ